MVHPWLESGQVNAKFNADLQSFQWRNYVRQGEAAASGRQEVGGATEFNANDL